MNSLLKKIPTTYRNLRSGAALRWNVEQHLCTNNNEKKSTEGESRIENVLKDKFPQAKTIYVEDISGGCGSMYDIQIESPEFKGKRTVLQHRLVNEALKEEIKDMHGLRITTRVSDDS